MIQNNAVAYRDHLIYPLSVFDAASKKWHALVLVTRDTGDENRTLPRSQSFPRLPDEFDDEAAALEFALEYGRTAVDRMHQGLPAA